MTVYFVPSLRIWYEPAPGGNFSHLVGAFKNNNIWVPACLVWSILKRIAILVFHPARLSVPKQIFSRSSVITSSFSWRFLLKCLCCRIYQLVWIIDCKTLLIASFILAQYIGFISYTWIRWLLVLYVCRDRSECF